MQEAPAPWIAGAIVCLALAGLLLYSLVIRPWHVRWGASDAETQGMLPGDDIVARAARQTTRAVTVKTAAARIWPWLLQMGQGRGGLYSYDALENLVGCDIHTLDEIVPRLQSLKVGDTISIGPQKGLPYYTVALLQPTRALVLRAVNPVTGLPGETWCFYLAEEQPRSTRLVVRHRSGPAADSTEQMVNGIFEPITFVMERKMLLGVRERAEKMLPSGPSPADVHGSGANQ
jgi:hypothetical protein